MGMSTHVVGFKPPDAKWKKMKAAWDACADAGADPPKAVLDFFGHESPDAEGVRVSERELVRCGAVKEYHAKMVDGYDIDVRKLPPDVTLIRVYNSY